MKVFCLIFGIYILLLSFSPCEEMTADLKISLEKSSPQTTVSGDAQTEKQSDDCSPFCICSCCHLTTVYQLKAFSVTNKITVKTTSRPNFSYRNPYSQSYKTSIWQPPKFNSKA